MAKVLKHSIETNSSVGCTIKRIGDSDDDLRDRRYVETYVQNTRKTRHFAELVNNSTNGTVLLLLDCDMLCIRDIGDLTFPDGYDIALTYRDKSNNRYMFNTGFVAIRVSDKMQKFCLDWAARAEELLRDGKQHSELRKKYGGINQSSLGSLLESREDIRVKKLTTSEWNSLPSNIDTVSNARLVHIMGELRTAIIYNRKPRIESGRQEIFNRWKTHERSLASTS